MGINCVPLLANLFLHLHEADIIQVLLKMSENKLAFSLSSRPLHDVPSLNNSECGDLVERNYPIEHDIKDTIDYNTILTAVPLFLTFLPIVYFCFVHAALSM